MFSTRLQRTIAHPVAVCGYGFWSGEPVQVEFRPAAVNHGVVFVREDISADAEVPARVEHRIQVPRRSNLQRGAACVEMVEHVLAALAGLHIDNCEICVDAAEMPGSDGSAIEFVQALDAAGTVEQQSPTRRLKISELVRIESGESWIEARPPEREEFRVEFRLDYPDDPIIGQQSVALDVCPASFRKELAPCRTFVLEREADALIRQGLGTHVTPNDLLLFGKYGPVDNRLRFPNECARHKALDLVGDLSLTGCEVIGRVTAHRSSHQLNCALASELLRRFGVNQTLKASA